MTIGSMSPYAAMPCAAPPQPTPAQSQSQMPGPAPIPCGAVGLGPALVGGGTNAASIGAQLQAGLQLLQHVVPLRGGGNVTPVPTGTSPSNWMPVVSRSSGAHIGAIRPDGTYVPNAEPLARGDRSALRAQLHDLFVRRGSPMAGSVDALIDASLRHGVDPRLLVAIAGQESEFGTTNPPSLAHNPFGFFWNGDSNSPFESWEAGYERVATRVAEMIHDQGFTSVGAIGEGDPNVRDDGYSEVGAGNDPTGLNNGWISGVSAMYRELGGNPDDVRLQG